MSRELGIQAIYLASSVLFILGLKSLTRPAFARRGMQQAAVGMLLAIVGTLFQQEIVRFDWIAGGLILGTVIGYPLGMFVPMTAMPQRIAISHLFGALAATLVGVAEYWHGGHGSTIGHGKMAALGFEVLFGALTVTGSFMAFGKLQEFVTGTPVTYRGQNAINLALFAVTFGLFGYLIFFPTATLLFYLMIALALCIGVLMVLPIGGADMPVVVSLLNSYAGLASSATGFAIGNNVLIIAGALDGASGFLLSVIMSKAMNRSFGNVLFGAFGTPQVAAGGQDSRRPHRPLGVRRGRGDAARLREQGHLRSRVRDGGGPGAAPGAGAGRAHREEGGRGEVRHPPGGRPHARAHERAAGRGRRPLRPAVRHGRD